MGYRFGEHRFGSGLYSWEFEYQAVECENQGWEPTTAPQEAFTPLAATTPLATPLTAATGLWSPGTGPSTSWVEEVCAHG